ncbi:MAG: helix-turn-helix transcriptional regulator [Lachnospiraceae bacterium]
MEKDLKKLFSAHHPDKDFLKKNCNHYYCDMLSIASIIPSADRVTNPFSHSHEEYEFLIPYGPIPMILVEDAVYFGEVGYVYPFESNQEHSTKFRISNVAHDRIVIDKVFFESVLEKKGCLGKEFGLPFECSNELKSYIQLFKDEFDKGDRRDFFKLENLAFLISATIVELEFSYETTFPKDSQQYQKGIFHIASYMNRNYTEELQVEDLANMCKLSKNYFISSFKKVMGETPYSYLTKLRISKAKVLLETTDLPIQEIASSCGFQKSNTFTSLFKSVTSKTPSEYRKSLL